MSAIGKGLAFVAGSGSGGGAVASVFGRAGAVVAAIGDYTAAQVTNAADKATAATQAFVGSITSNGTMTAQIVSAARSGTSAGLAGAFAGKVPTGTYLANSFVLDTTDDVWIYTPGGGVNPTDWIVVGAAPSVGSTLPLASIY